MAVKELKNALKGYKADDEVYFVKDWEICNENGELTELTPVQDITSQRVVVDMGLDFEDITQVLIVI